MYGHSARSPPPLQHPRPQHPPSHIPSASPPPESWNSSRGSTSSEYQRFASPPVFQQPQHVSGSQLHPSQAGFQQSTGQSYGQRGIGQSITPDAYIPQQQQPYGSNSQFIGGGQQHGNVQWMGDQTQSNSARSQPNRNQPHPASNGFYGGQPQTASSSSGGGQGSQGGGPSGIAGFGQSMGMGGMMNDATAQMGMQFGSHAFSAGQAYLDKNFTRLLPLAHLKHSFNVSNGYVVNKLRLLVWPWRHRPWSRGVVRSETTGVAEGWKPPREDINCPDLYIPGEYFSRFPSSLSDLQDDFPSQSWHS